MRTELTWSNLQNNRPVKEKPKVVDPGSQSSSSVWENCCGFSTCQRDRRSYYIHIFLDFWKSGVVNCCVFQAQYGYMVVQMLMSHLDENSRKEAQIKVSIIDVLSVTVLISAGGSIGLLILIFVFTSCFSHFFSFVCFYCVIHSCRVNDFVRFLIKF